MNERKTGMNTLEELQKWYASNCDGEWEEECGVTIETLDNPGWSVTIDLFETNLEGKEFSHLKDDVSGDSWIECRVEDNKFIGFGDPERLEQILKVFIEWLSVFPSHPRAAKNARATLPSIILLAIL
jgi:hypothetical protein